MEMSDPDMILLGTHNLEQSTVQSMSVFYVDPGSASELATSAGLQSAAGTGKPEEEMRSCLPSPACPAQRIVHIFACRPN